MPRKDRPHVVISGGGVAALEALLALRVLVGHSVRITLVAPQPDFVVRPLSVAEPFDRGEARKLALHDIAIDQGASLVPDSLSRVDVAGHAIETLGERRLEYDALIVATGAVPTEPLPGATTFRGPQDVEPLRGVLDDIVSGAAHSAAFVVPADTAWSLPLYELALMAGAHVRAEGINSAALTVVTPEAEPLQAFGPAAGHALRELLAERGIALRVRAQPDRVDATGLVLAGGDRIPADRVVTVSVLEGPGVPGLPADARGFLRVDGHGRVEGAKDVYAAGDVTAHPLKQGGLAAQQADAVAEAIAAWAGGAIEPQPFRPVLRGLLLTGGVPVYLRSEPGRMAPEPTVATKAATRPRIRPASSVKSTQALWWPPGKIAGRYLAPYLATARPPRLGSAPMIDRAAIAGSSASDAGRQDALELAAILADEDARWGDYASALRALEAVEALEGTLPPEYEHKRRLWAAELTAVER